DRAGRVWVSLVAILVFGALPVAAQTAPAPAPDAKAILESLEQAFVSVAERVMPAVVHIDATPKESSRERGPREGRDPRERLTPPERREFERRFREFFGEDFERFVRQRPPERRESRNQGSRAIVHNSALALTTNSRIHTAPQI